MILSIVFTCQINYTVSIKLKYSFYIESCEELRSNGFLLPQEQMVKSFFFVCALEIDNHFIYLFWNVKIFIYTSHIIQSKINEKFSINLNDCNTVQSILGN